MDALDALRGRRSIRKFDGRPVGDADLERILRAAMAAPSAGNQQPWRFVVLSDRAVLERVAAASPHAGMLRSAPVGIVVCGDLSEVPEDQRNGDP